jgi:CMP-N-acetylneuraminic acid synthetase
LTNIIGVIHARGGSVRIPKKNIKLLGGKPLITYMIQAALGSKQLRRVIVSTDDDEIKRISEEAGAEVPFKRPENLSSDCPSELVTQHAVEFVENQENQTVDIAVTLQPTTPFCRSQDIDSCVNILLNSPELNSVITGKLVSERPEWMFRILDNHRAKLVFNDEIKGDTGVYQSLPELATVNGAAYATRRHTLFDEGVIISSETGIHLMSHQRSIDIDVDLDFKFAEFMLNKLDDKL